MDRQKNRKKTDMQTSIKLNYVHGQVTILNSESTVPLEIPFPSQSFLVPPLHPLPSPVRILCATRLLQSSPVHVPCPPLPLSVTPVSPRHPLHGRWLLGEVVCSLYTITLAVTNHEN